MTITEALAEIKTIGKRIKTKQEGIVKYLARNESFRDPMQKEGGSIQFVHNERQAIGDLGDRVIALRTAIQSANMKTKLKVGDTEHTIFEWLIWRREVAPVLKKNVDELWNGVQQVRNAAMQKGMKVLTATAAASSDNGSQDVIINVDEKALTESRENLDKIMGDLDGQLSLLNATTDIGI